MKKLTRHLATAGFVLALAGSALTLASVEDEIRQRIKPEGNVNVAGEARQKAAKKEKSHRPGEEVYAAACGACHDSGAAGAPRMGKTGEWSARFDKGAETLYKHAINGYNAMPAKGGCTDCSDEEVENAVDYIMAETQ